MDTMDSTVTLIDFHAPWCGPCRAMEPVFEEIEQEYAGRVTIEKVNVDEEQERASQAGVMSIPTLHIVKDGKILQTLIGYQSKDDLGKVLDQALR